MQQNWMMIIFLLIVCYFVFKSIIGRITKKNATDNVKEEKNIIQINDGSELKNVQESQSVHDKKNSFVDELEKIQKMKEAGYLTEEDFQKVKKNIFSSLK